MKQLLVAIAMSLACLTPVRAYADDAEDLLSDLESAMSDVQDSIDDLESYRSVDENSDADERSDAERAMRRARQQARSAAVSLLLASVDPARPGDLDRVLESIYIVMPELKKKPDARRKK